MIEVELLPPINIRDFANAVAQAGILNFEQVYGLAMGLQEPGTVGLSIGQALGNFSSVVEQALDDHVGQHPVRDLVYQRVVSLTRHS